MTERCSKMFPSVNAPDHQCRNRGRYYHEGNPYCLLHHPEKQIWQEARRIACEAAFHSPDGRKIATEDIAPGVVWKLRDTLENLVERVVQDISPTATPRMLDEIPSISEARALLSSLKIQEPER